MDTVMLPKVHRSTSLFAALERMRVAQRSGLLVEIDFEKIRLLYLGQLLKAIEGQVETVGEIREAHRVVVLDMGRSQQSGLDLVRPYRTEAAFENFLVGEQADYALAGDSSDMAMVVTKSETQRAALTMTGGYRCTGKPRHYFPEPSVSAGQDCPRYPECSASGTRPTIVPA